MSHDNVLLEVCHLAKSYKELTPLRDVSCEIRRGEVISVIGPSGTGKSTFLRCINRLEVPDSGEILFSGTKIDGEGKRLRKIRQKIGMVFQSFNLFSNMTVFENVTLGPVLLRGMSREKAKDQAERVLKTVGLSGKMNHYPDTLSGGEKQRVAIARALSMDPDLLLMDEPTSALDPAMTDEVNTVIQELASKGYTMLIVTHDMRFARTVSNRIFFMYEGVIHESGTPEVIFDRPLKEETRIFVHRLKVCEKVFESGEIDYAAVAGELTDYARNQFMSRRSAQMLVRIFEEAVLELLSPHAGVFPVKMRALYDNEEGESRVSISYQGDDYNPLAEDTVSGSVLKGTIPRIQHLYSDGENRLIFRF